MQPPIARGATTNCPRCNHQLPFPTKSEEGKKALEIERPENDAMANLLFHSIEEWQEGGRAEGGIEWRWKVEEERRKVDEKRVEKEKKVDDENKEVKVLSSKRLVSTQEQASTLEIWCS